MTQGKGFDLTSDFKLKYCKGKERLVLLNEMHDINFPDFGSIKNVSINIKCDKGDLTRYQSDILKFNKLRNLVWATSKHDVYLMSHFSVVHWSWRAGKIPSGYFNAMFNLESGSWVSDVAHTKYWRLDGYFITLLLIAIPLFSLMKFVLKFLLFLGSLCPIKKM
ncbi:hypothetical protein Patl1_25796 [Pistacia atlantica]|uniref:Uncharacterized protein n=1 Tax=Pistacia atlantica TaxID=434234 RepID=A0ACC1B3S4_9ROSI|nr:hypothetical protein Patl1_25796 [Pistacia atlantica]